MNLNEVLDMELPLVRALLVTLLGLDEDDTRLPLGVLVRLNSRLLRAPLRNCVRLADLQGLTDRKVDRWKIHDGIKAFLKGSYPGLANGRLFEEDEKLEAAYNTSVSISSDVEDIFDLREDVESEAAIRVLAWSASNGWYAYDPLVILYLLGSRRELAPHFAPILERELELHPDVLKMILDMSQA